MQLCVVSGSLIVRFHKNIKNAPIACHSALYAYLTRFIAIRKIVKSHRNAYIILGNMLMAFLVILV